MSRAFSPSLGGAETFAEVLAQWLTERGHDVTIVTESPSGTSSRPSPYRVLREPSLLELRRCLSRSDVIHVNGLAARMVVGSLLTGRRPVVTHIGHHAICPTGLALGIAGACPATAATPGPCRECPAGHGLGSRVMTKSHRAAASAARVNVCVSHYLRGRLGIARSRVIYNPLPSDTIRSAATSARTDTLVFVGRLVREKGVDLLLRAVAAVSDAQLRIVGDGPERGALHALAIDLGLADRVTFLGSRSRDAVLDEMDAASVVCVPSVVHEAFGYVAAEAMAGSRAVVATPLGGVEELLAHRRGFLADSVTSPSLAAAIRMALSNEAERTERGGRARQFVLDNLTVASVGTQYLKAYGASALG